MLGACRQCIPLTTLVYVLRRVIDYLLMPIGLAWVLGLAALLVFFISRNRSKGWSRRLAFGLGVAAVVVLYVGSIRPTAAVLMAWLEAPYPVKEAIEIEPVDAVMVLGGATTIVRRSDGGLAVDPGRRFEAAMRLIEGNRARILVLSGAGPRVPNDPRTEAEHLRELAILRGIPPDRIVATPHVATSGDEVRELAALAREHRWARVAITTDSWHLGRALRLAAHEGLQAIPFSSGRAPPPPLQPWLLDWIPGLEGLTYTTNAWHEMLGHFAD